METCFQELRFKPIYTTQKNDVVSEFYVPVLSRSISYDRVTGFFSSSALSTVARGLSKFLSNPNSKMRLLVSCKGFRKSDSIESIYSAEKAVVDEFERILNEDVDNLADLIVQKRIAALAWLLKTGRLEIKVAILTPLQYEGGILHSKFGILKDRDGDVVCFSGSINESVTGWKINGEAISVFRNYEAGQLDYIVQYEAEFADYWNNRVHGTTVIPLPKAISNKLISYSATNIVDVLDYIDPELRVAGARTLWYYQSEAIDRWLKNQCVGYFEMATGTGKTLGAELARFFKA